jgi:hypothetical protein
MATITKFTKITGWKQREEVQALGDVSLMIADPVVHTVLSGRAAVVSAWYDEATGTATKRPRLPCTASKPNQTSPGSPGLSRAHSVSRLPTVTDNG